MGFKPELCCLYIFDDKGLSLPCARINLNLHMKVRSSTVYGTVHGTGTVHKCISGTETRHLPSASKVTDYFWDSVPRCAEWRNS